MPPKSPTFDYAFAGAGLAGLQLALALIEDPFFKNKKIGLIDKSTKTENDKTWCFWETGTGKWEALLTKSWQKGWFYSDEKTIPLRLPPYRYKMIRSLNFYTYARQKLEKSPHVFFIQDEVDAVEESKQVVIYGKKNNYTAHHLFDSRIPAEYFNEKEQHTRILQHFKGWMIETNEPVFNPEEFTMMDYRLRYKESTSFTYVLPLSATKAFVEYTFFTPCKVEESVYDAQLQKYISQFLTQKDYRITETEKGVIPMTDFPFWKYNTQKTTKIGTAGGWVKASTGYSFKNTEKKIAQLIENLKNNKNPADGLHSKRFQFYDKIFLKVLQQENQKGPWIFKNFYQKNSIQQVFRYLDEETPPTKDLKIMGSLFSSAFIKAFFKVW